MNLLFIIHAVSWSDKGCTARIPITQILERGGFDRIIEVVPARPDIIASRYLSHDGEVLEHAEISPVPFFREALFGPQPLFPPVDSVVLVGGHLNTTGGGCLNVAFDHLVRYLNCLGAPSSIVLPMRATYSAQSPDSWRDPSWTKQIAEDLGRKMIAARIPFRLLVGERCVSSDVSSGAQMTVMLDASTGDA